MIHRLNQYFIDKMRETAYAMFPDTMSSVPNFPACMVYLNPAALKRNEVITQRLRRVWRGSVSDICCYQAVPIKGGCRFCHTDGKEADLLSEVQRMSSSNTKFYNPAKLNVYCILDTSDLKDMNALLFCINMACYFKQVVRMPNVQLFLMKPLWMNRCAALILQRRFAAGCAATTTIFAATLIVSV